MSCSHPGDRSERQISNPAGKRTGGVERTSMELLRCRNRIIVLMSRFVTEVEGSSALGQFDIHSVSETLLTFLLREVYDLTNLRNLNIDEYTNYPAIDLGDEHARVAFQVTADPSSEKIKQTLQRFMDHKLYESYDHLRIYVLTKKQLSYSSKRFAEIIAGKFSFDPPKDILDFSDILSSIGGFQLDKIKPILDLLEDNFGERAIAFDDMSTALQSFLDDNTGVLNGEIARTQMMSELEAFALDGSGIVVGVPGVGKSHSLRRLAGRLQSSDRSCIYIPIDRLVLNDGDSVRTDTGIKLGIIDHLSRLTGSDGTPGILLLDAFDAARSEQTQRILLGLIHLVQHEFSQKWHVIASVRTYDGQRSQRLQELFPPRSDVHPTDGFQTSGVRCRHFAIPELIDSEVEDTIRGIPHLADIYAAATTDFRSLLRVPFNIWLLQELFAHSEDIPNISDVASAVQLLDLFWRYRVLNDTSGEGKRVMLSRITKAMVLENTLSVRREQVFDFRAEDQWNLLFSANVLHYASPAEQRIVFSHNILFDYAVSKLLIEDDPVRLVEFLSEDPARPLFLRPSLVLYLCRLWHESPDLFWRTIWHVIGQTKDVHIRLFGRLLPPVVIINEARHTEDFGPLLKAMRAGEDDAFQAMLRILQAMISSETTRDALWLAFLADASNCLTRDIAGSFATLATKISERAKLDDRSVWPECGLVARALGQWFWSEVGNQKDDWLINVGAHWIFPLVTMTFDTDPEESRGILRHAIDLIGEDKFPIDLVREVVNGLDKVYPHDPEFAAEVYTKVFDHGETSQEAVVWGGRVMGFRSTRKQDYEMCQYQLADLFPGFLRQAPVIATSMLVNCVNIHVIRDHIIRYTKDEAQVGDLTRTFKYQGKTVTYIEDQSYIWDSTSLPDDLIRMTEEFCTYILELAQEPTQQSLLQDLIYVFRDNQCVAFLWRQLLATAAQTPHAFAKLLFDLCIARPMQVGNDTIVELGQYLEAAAREFSPEQLSVIETSILAIPSEPADGKRSLIKKRNRLLARIPKDLLSTDDGKQIWKEMENTDSVPANKPLCRTGSWSSGPYSEETWPNDHGVDVDTPINQHLLSLSKSLKDFHAKWRNEVPAAEVVDESIADARQAYEIVQHSIDLDESVVELLLTELAEYAEIVSRAADILRNDQFQFCRDVLLSCAVHKSAKPRPERDRIAGARGLVQLAARRPDLEMLHLIEKLSGDPVPSVRFYSLTEIWKLHHYSPEVFWRVMIQCAAAEPHPTIIQVLFASLRYVIGSDESLSVQVLATLVDRLLPLDKRDEAIDDSDTIRVLLDLMPLLVWLVTVRNNKWAYSTIDRVFAEPVRFAEPIGVFVSDGVRCIAEMDVDTNAPIETIVPLLAKAVDAAIAGVNELQKVTNDQWDEEWNKKTRSTYDIIHNTVSHIYFPLRNRNLLPKPSKQPLPDGVRRIFYGRIRPILDHILHASESELPAGLPAHTAHYFLELLNDVLAFEPVTVLHMATRLVRSSKWSGYHLDPMAIKEAVRLVETVLADHIDTLKQKQSLSDVLDILDIFSEAGWPAAQKLVWRLDEVFR